MCLRTTSTSSMLVFFLGVFLSCPVCGTTYNDERRPTRHKSPIPDYRFYLIINAEIITKEVVMKQQDSSASKKQKVDSNKKDEKLQHEELLIRSTCVSLDPIQPSILRQIDEFKDSFLLSYPFQHCCIRNFCVDGFLEKVLDEVKQNSKVKFKESDLFRMYQSVDLGNLKEDSELASKMPSLMQLKHALYSYDFRSFMEQLTNLEPGTLIDKIDCAVNCHTKGCHLLCHDDVIGTRKISYILYLTDPTSSWRDEQGGKLELYESTIKDDDDRDQPLKRSKRIPAVFPCKTILPTFNSLVFFVVTPGQSFHSVQEVFGDSPRLSIQGGYLYLSITKTLWFIIL